MQKWKRIEAGRYECGTYTITRTISQQTYRADEVCWTLSFKGKVVADCESLADAKRKAERHAGDKDDQFSQFFGDANTAFGFAQGAVRRALEANDVTISNQDGWMIFSVHGKQVARLDPKTKTTVWDGPGNSTRQQDALIRAHVTLVVV